MRYKKSQAAKLKSPFLISAEQQPLQTCNGPWWQTCRLRRRTEKTWTYTLILFQGELENPPWKTKIYNISFWKIMDEQEGNTSCLGGSSQDGRFRVILVVPNRPFYGLYLGLSPFPVIVTTIIVTFFVGEPELNLHLPLSLGWGDNPTYNHLLAGRILQAWLWVLDFCQFSTPTHKSTHMQLGFWHSVRKLSLRNSEDSL